MVGDCKNIPCGTSITFESALMSLFAKNAQGCVGIKVFSTSCDCGAPPGPPRVDCEDANPCTTQLSLSQLITRAFVDDGCGGNALSVAYLNQLPDCPALCGMNLDLETVLKRLFVKIGDCFALRATVAPLTCNDGQTFSRCATHITAEQVIKGSVFEDGCGGLVLPTMMQSIECDATMGCDLSLTLDQILAGLFIKFDHFCGGAIQLNPISVDCETLTDLLDCGTFYTFEEMFKRSLVRTECGAAINVFVVNNLLQ